MQPSEIPDPWKFVEIYHDAAINAKNAGFDGVEGASGICTRKRLLNY